DPIARERLLARFEAMRLFQSRRAFVVAHGLRHVERGEAAPPGAIAEIDVLPEEWGEELVIAAQLQEVLATTQEAASDRIERRVNRLRGRLAYLDPARLPRPGLASLVSTGGQPGADGGHDCEEPGP